MADALPSPKPKRMNKLQRIVLVVLILAAAGGIFAWYKFFREVPQPPFANGEERFKTAPSAVRTRRAYPTGS